MISRKLDKDLVFFNPGEKEVIFTYKAGHTVDFDMIDRAVDNLEYETGKDVVYVEDRRKEPREA